MADYKLALKNITKKFGNTTAVKDVSFEVKEGEFFTLLGPSGCGKTTTLNVIEGIVEPDKGEVWLDGEEISDKPPYERETSLVFQDYALFPHKNVFENIAFGLEERGEDNIKEKVRQTLERVDLAGYEEKRISQLSGGEQQRVATARSIVVEPSVLLLDEPLSNLDRKLRISMRVELEELIDDLDITTIYVTHDQAEALSMSDRVCIMNNGRIKEIGTPRKVYNQPKGRFVMDFIGDTNHMKGKVLKKKDSSMQIGLKKGKTIQARANENLKKKDSVGVYIRPKSMKISPDPLSCDNVFKAEVIHSSFTGPITLYVCKWNDLRIEVKTESERRFSVGRKVFIGWDKEAVYTFKKN